jgi:sulfur-oxidizing protein SoxA
MARKLWIMAAAAGFSLTTAGTALTGEQDWGSYQTGEKRSGYTYAKAETRTIQDDDFDNPGFLWVDTGEELWDAVDGGEGKACATCHGDAAESMAKVGATYPVFAKELGKPINVEQRINQCRSERMGAEPWKWESQELLAMTSYVKNQSHGAPMSVALSDELMPFYRAGEDFYYQRRGQLDMACSTCHVDNAGGQLRANVLSQGQANGFPTYRLKWQKVGSLHRRFRGCNSQVRATPFANGSDEYVNLELYLTHRSNGLPVETPAVRN